MPNDDLETLVSRGLKQLFPDRAYDEFDVAVPEPPPRRRRVAPVLAGITGVAVAAAAVTVATLSSTTSRPQQPTSAQAPSYGPSLLSPKPTRGVTYGPTTTGHSTGDCSSAAPSSLPPLSAAAVSRLAAADGVDVNGAPSPAAHAPMSAQAAMVLACAATGLLPSSAVAASFTSITTPGMGPVDQRGNVTAPLYSNREVWAIDFGNVTIQQRGGVGSTNRSYVADMVAFIDANTGTFLFASQYNPPKPR